MNKSKTVPGICLKCGHDTRDERPGYQERDTGGYCNKCHNENYFEYKAARKVQISAKKGEGIKYWQDKGIKIGDKVTRIVVSFMFMASQQVYGIAKAGSCGAYVTSNFQSGKLSPNNWVKA